MDISNSRPYVPLCWEANREAVVGKKDRRGREGPEEWNLHTLYSFLIEEIAEVLP